MKVIKKINNNIAIAVDGENNEVIVFAKGIGYGNIPYEIKDLSVIERTFYDVDNRYYGLLKEIPNNIFNLVTKMVDVAKKNIEDEITQWEEDKWKANGKLHFYIRTILAGVTLLKR